MEQKERIINLYLWLLLPMGAGVVIWAMIGFRFDKFGAGLAGLSIAAGCLSFLFRNEKRERVRSETAKSRIRELENYIAEMEINSEDIRETRESLRIAVFQDALTGLPSRNSFISSVHSQTEKSKLDPDYKFAVLFLDLNRFKTINDSLGHSTGDRLIKSVAIRLSQAVREGDLVSRFSGDEFAVLLSGITDVAEAVGIAGRLVERIAEPFMISARWVFTSVSIGIAFNSDNYSVPEEILRDADIAMHFAKENGRDLVIFDQNMHTRAVSLQRLETDLRLALEREELEVYYQPIVDLGDTTLAGFEALIRWNHPVHGMIPPNDFIPLSETTGLIIPMTLQILRTVCLQFVDWQKRFPSDEPLTVSVNLSGKHFAHPELLGQLKTILQETKITPGCLKLEITESALMANAESSMAMLKQIRETGVQIAIDDFGTGHSSLSYLQRFSIDCLKIDRSFVNTMEDGSDNGEIVRTVLALAKILRLCVVAEGIENIHQFHQLRVLGCEFGQGYLFSRPLPVQEIEKMLDDKMRFRNIVQMPDYGSVAQNQEHTQITAAL